MSPPGEHRAVFAPRGVATQSRKLPDGEGDRGLGNVKVPRRHGPGRTWVRHTARSPTQTAMSSPMTDSNSHAESDEQRDSADAETTDTYNDVAYYECPHCGWAESTEAKVRLHITREDDHKHRGRNGFSASENVIVYAENGDQLDILEGDTAAMTELEEGELSTDLIPEDIAENEAEREVLLTAVLSPRDSVAEVHRNANDKLDADDAVSYERVRYLLKKAGLDEGRPDGRSKRATSTTDTDTDTEDADESSAVTFADLTDNQQAVLELYAKDPARSWTDYAKTIDVSPTYPQSVVAGQGKLLGEGVTGVDIARRHFPFSVPTIAESRVMYAARQADDPHADPLRQPGGKVVDYEWPEPKYGELTFAQKAIVDYVLDAHDGRPNELVRADAAEVLQYPPGYIELVAARYADLIRDLRESEDEAAAQVERTRGNSTYKGRAGGLDLTHSYLGERARIHKAHVKRAQEVEEHGFNFYPEPPPEPEPGEEPEEYACAGCGKRFDSYQALGGHVPHCPDTDDEPETTTVDARGEHAGATAGEAPDEGDTTQVSLGALYGYEAGRDTVLIELRDEVARLKALADRGADRGEPYAAGQADALEHVLDLIDEFDAFGPSAGEDE